MSHTVAAWIQAHALLLAVGVAVLAIVLLRCAGASASRAVRKAGDRALAVQARRARDLGLDLSYRKTDLLDRLERRRWWRRGR
jgi:hypothetical protein